MQLGDHDLVLRKSPRMHFSAEDAVCSFLSPDLSENKIGALAAHELREYMRSSRCKLRSLAIRKADIDDDECRYPLSCTRKAEYCTLKTLLSQGPF